MARQISAPTVIGDYAGYTCPVSGRWIEGRKAHTENLRRTGSRLFEPGEREAYSAARAKDDQILEAKIERTADEFIAKLPGEKRDRLAAEMENGLDVQLTRQSA